MTRQILVVGNARGGTTATCGVIRMLGVPFPECNDNHENVRWFKHVIRLGEREPIDEYNAKYTKQWGQKIIAPRDWEYLPQRVHMLSDPWFVCVWRDPIAVGLRGGNKPIDNRNYTTWVANLEDQIQRLKWLHTHLRPARPQINSKIYPVLHISYEKLCSNIPQGVELIREWLDLPTTKFRDACNYVRPGSYWPWEDKDDPVTRNVTHRMVVEPAEVVLPVPKEG